MIQPGGEDEAPETPATGAAAAPGEAPAPSATTAAGETETTEPPREATAAADDAANRRQFERVGVAFALLVRDGTRRIGTIEDISAGGMRVRLDDEVGENEDIREWTGHKGADNKQYTLQTLVGEEFTLTIHYLAVTMGTVKARLIRVIRIMRQLFFAMQFTEADPVTVQRIMDLVKRRSSS